MLQKRILLLVTLCLCFQPLQLAADFSAAGFFEGMNNAMNERRQRGFERELLERRLEHEREMLRLQQGPPESNPAPSRNFVVLPEIDFYGGDISQNGIRGVSLDTCVQICVENGLCLAVTWVPSQSWCFPKGQGFSKQLNESVVSVQVR
jgi:hypothetical protein